MIVRSKAPLRLGLAGGGTDINDYASIYGGYVLNTTINLYSHTTLEDSDKIEFIAKDINENFSSEIKILNSKINLELHRGVYNRIVKDFFNNKPFGIKITTYSDAPIGSGLGSSSSMVVCILQAFTEKYKLPLGEYDISRLAYDIERNDLGFSGGSQDQYSASFGGFNFMEFYKDKVIVNPLRIKKWFQDELSESMIIYFTGVSRYSGDIIEDQIINIKKKSNPNLEAMHNLKLSALKMKEYILKNNIKDFAKELEISWNEKKKMSYNISNQHINKIYDTAINLGAYSGKVSGAGGGGFMMFICNPTKKIDIMKGLTLKYGGEIKDIQFEPNGALAWTIN